MIIQKTSLILLGILSSTFLTGCACTTEETIPDETLTEMTEEERFISANAELACEVLNNPGFILDAQTRKAHADNYFTKYGFPAENDEEMLALLDKYEMDEEVQKKVETKIDAECVLE